VCAERGLPAPVVGIVGGRIDDIVGQIARWREAGVTAVCAHNDEVALMVMAAMNSLGLVPGVDLAVIGVDDIPLANMGLSTVSIDSDVFTAVLIERVVSVLEEREPVYGDRPLLSLVLRSSA
jgi:DNA-binding LacI/PurR family transcriptional regulator